MEGAGHARQTVDEQDDLAAAFKLGLNVGQHQFGQFYMLIRLVVDRAGDDLGARYSPPEVCHFFGTLIDEQHDDTALRRADADGLHDLFEQNGFAGTRRRDDQLPGALADGGDQVHDAHALHAGGAKVETLVRIHGHQVCKPAAALKGVRLQTSD